jgi:hypothetical protein
MLRIEDRLEQGRQLIGGRILLQHISTTLYDRQRKFRIEWSTTYRIISIDCSDDVSGD